MTTLTATWHDWLLEERRRRELAGLQRALRPLGAEDSDIDLAGNDYLGLSRHPAVTEAAADAARRWGAGARASRLVTGTLALHQELEDELAVFLDQPAALVLSTGYHANLAVVTALASRGRVISDAHVHASLIDGCRLARATVQVTAHNDVDAVADALAASTDERTLILVESIYSVLGDAAPLRELATLAVEHDALLVVDEAHAIGVRGPGGRGLVHELGLNGHPNLVLTATLSKSFAAQGGAVLAPLPILDHLVNVARPFIFDTGLAPAACAGAQAALRLLRAEPERPATIRRRTRELARRLDVAAPDGAVLSVPMPSPQAALAAQAAIGAEGIRVACFRPPSVPDGVSRLRITVNAGLDDATWEHAVTALAEIAGRFR
ncbi:8-amino-7-oxononanoate synthase [Nocardioides sp. Bht2]|uniref:8-amino-7-oxononanoate synthase n=1 Tax=Nocardioides sp. Bht2 TaxID=3392297 RepID=UPI0039B424E1